jgi:hypothetical protein
VNTQEIVTALDAEIARLQEARKLIAQVTSVEDGRRPTKARPAVQLTMRRVLSPEARKKIAAAQRRRWAKQKSAKKAAPLKKAAKTVQGRKAISTKKAPAKAAKTAKKTVHVKKIPSKTRSERKPRTAKKAVAANTLSSRAEVVAVNKPESLA